MHNIYNFFNELNHIFDPRDYIWDYRRGDPVSYLVIDNFLPDDILKNIQQEIPTIPKHYWTDFTRNGSYMKECKSFKHAPNLQTLTHCLNSGTFVNWLEAVTDKKKLISDPHLIGAGLSECTNGSSLKLHTDFNWNDELSLNRSLSLILYLSPEWNADWGGGLDFWDFDRTKKITSVAPIPNRLLLWNYNNRFIHGYPDPLTCPESHSRLNLRLFYYTSNAVPLSPPHRSLYWWDEEKGMPVDRREQK
jgi:Rps23 Pro-64 3,4-dihydroxylase Tpa1-like proline 4-hydroxylase